MNKMNEKFKFMSFLDCARWRSKNNYYAINMANKNASGEQVLLTHFLGYITNRQTPFKIIFERLDYIFSQLVRDFFYGASVDELLSPNKPETSFFVKGDGEDLFFISHAQNYEDSQLPEITKKLQENNKGVFYASSRFYPTDYAAIYFTLDMLEKKFNRSFFSFIKWAIGNNPEKEGLERLLYAFWVLGYRGVGQWDVEKIKSDIAITEDYQRILKEKTEILEEFSYNGFDSKYYKKEFARGHKKSNRFKSKRAICYLRDLFKYPLCADILSKKLGEKSFNLLKSQIPDVLEFPGDVWNNNRVFQKCLNIVDSKRKTDSPNYLIRKLYDELCDKIGKEKVGCYPEQFDCSFNFVPRMCDVSGQANCQFCPIEPKYLEKNSNHIHIPDEFCHHNKDKFCPFLLFAVGYKVKCKDIEKCPNRHNPQ